MMSFIVCFSYGLDKDGSFGATNEARCEKAAALYKELKKRSLKDTWIIATAGMIPDFPQQQKPLCMMQREALGKLGVPLPHVLPNEIDFKSKWRERNVLSTMAEVDAAIAIADDKKSFGPFYAVSHWFHLPRIWWLGRLRGIRFVLKPVWSATPWKSVAAEFPKWIVVLVDSVLLLFGKNGIGKRATQLARAYHIW
jgi:hypothetical protein